MCSNVPAIAVGFVSVTAFMVVSPLALNVVNAPVLGVVAPMAVEFRPVEVSVATVLDVPAETTFN